MTDPNAEQNPDRSPDAGSAISADDLAEKIESGFPDGESVEAHPADADAPAP